MQLHHSFCWQGILAIVGIALGCAPRILHAGDPSDTAVVFAAASLSNVLQELGDAYAQSGGAKPQFSFASSSTLARQIENGAKADVFLSADEEWMDYLDQRGLVQKPTRRDLLGNRLALVAPADSRLQLRIEPKFPLLVALNGGRLATGDPDSVPAGRYARAALAKLGVWDDVAGRLARGDSVRTALAFVSRGEAPLGIVYETDARIDKGVRIVDLFPDDSHPPILYPVALTSAARAQATGFLDFLRGPVGTAAFRKYGFRVLSSPP